MRINPLILENVTLQDSIFLITFAKKNTCTASYNLGEWIERTKNSVTFGARKYSKNNKEQNSEPNSVVFFLLSLTIMLLLLLLIWEGIMLQASVICQFCVARQDLVLSNKIKIAQSLPQCPSFSIGLAKNTAISPIKNLSVYRHFITK